MTQSNSCKFSVQERHFPVTRLSRFILVKTLEKFSFEEWINFHQCSSFSSNIGEVMTTQIRFHFDFLKFLPLYTSHSIKAELHKQLKNGELKKLIITLYKDDNYQFPLLFYVKKLAVLEPLKNSRMEIISKSLLSRRIFCHEILFTDQLQCSLDELMIVIEAMQCSKIYQYSYMDPVILDDPYISQLTEISLWDCSVAEQQLFRLRTTRIMLNGDRLSQSIISSFIEEWYNGQREIDNVSFSFKEHDLVDWIYPVFNFGTLYEFGGEDNQQYSRKFMLFRSNQKSNPLIIQINNRRFQASLSNVDDLPVPFDLIIETWRYCISCTNFQCDC